MVIRIKELKLGFFNKSILITLLLFIFLRGALYLNDKNIVILPEINIAKFNIISLMLVTFFIINLTLRFTIKRVYNYFEEPEEKIFFSKLYSWSFYLTGVIFILYNLGVSLNNITLLIGLFATGLAFAVRDVLFLFFSWIILLRKKPFRIGDYIKVGEDEGRVQHIGTFFVLLDQTPEIPEDYIRVPNKLFLEKSIKNFGRNTVHEKIRLQLLEFPDKKNEIIASLKEEILKKISKKDYVLVLIDLKEEKLYLVVEYLVNFEEKLHTRSEVIHVVCEKFKNYIYLPKE